MRTKLFPESKSAPLGPRQHVPASGDSSAACGCWVPLHLTGLYWTRTWRTEVLRVQPTTARFKKQLTTTRRTSFSFANAACDIKIKNHTAVQRDAVALFSGNKLKVASKRIDIMRYINRKLDCRRGEDPVLSFEHRLYQKDGRRVLSSSYCAK